MRLTCFLGMLEGILSAYLTKISIEALVCNLPLNVFTLMWTEKSRASQLASQLGCWNECYSQVENCLLQGPQHNAHHSSPFWLTKECKCDYFIWLENRAKRVCSPETPNLQSTSRRVISYLNSEKGWCWVLIESFKLMRTYDTLYTKGLATRLMERKWEALVLKMTTILVYFIPESLFFPFCS